MPAHALQIAIPRGSDEPRLALERRISLIVHRVNARFTQIANKLLSRQGINMYESRILLFLLKNGEMRVGELVEAMALPQSTMSHQLKQLQARKLIRRRRSRQDNRAVAVMLAPTGEEIARACERYSVHVQRGLLKHFGVRRMDELAAQLNAAFDFLELSRFSPDEIDGTAPPPSPVLIARGRPQRRRALRRADGP